MLRLVYCAEEPRPRRVRRESSRRIGIPLSREQLAWAAGFFDGEGTTYVLNRSGYPALSVPHAGTLADPPDVLLRFQAALGGLGLINRPIREKAGRRPLWTCRVCGYETVQAAVAMLWNWLGIAKRQQAAKVLMAYRSRPLLARREGVRTGRPLGIHTPLRHKRSRSGPRASTCERGHDLANAYVSPAGRRYCRECRRVNHHKSHLKRRGSVQASCDRG